MDTEKLVKAGLNIGAVICMIIMIKLTAAKPPQHAFGIFFFILSFVLRWIASRD